jgi:hypothetical protein
MASHSSVFGVLTWIADRLDRSVWPTHAETLEKPAVGVGAGYQSAPVGADTVDVVYRVEDDATIDWVTISPASRDERFLVDIYIRSMVRGQDRQRCWERLEELANVAQGVFYDPATLEFTPPGWEADGVHAPWYHPLGMIARVVPQAWPEPGGEGWVGECTVTVAVATRI